MNNESRKTFERFLKAMRSTGYVTWTQAEELAEAAEKIHDRLSSQLRNERDSLQKQLDEITHVRITNCKFVGRNLDGSPPMSLSKGMFRRLECVKMDSWFCVGPMTELEGIAFDIRREEYERHVNAAKKLTSNE